MKNTSPSKYSPSMYQHTNQINLKGMFNFNVLYAFVYRIFHGR